MKLAAFKNAVGNHVSYLTEEMGQTMIDYHKYARVSEFVDIEFPPLPIQVVVEGQLKGLDAAEQHLRNEFQRKLNELAEARANLLSLTHEAQS